MKRPSTYVIDTAGRLYDELIVAEHRVTQAVQRLGAAKAVDNHPGEIDRLNRWVDRLRGAVERATSELVAYAEDQNLIERATHVGIAAKRCRSWLDEDAVGIIADFLRSEGHRFDPLKPALADLAETSDRTCEQIMLASHQIATAIDEK